MIETSVMKELKTENFINIKNILIILIFESRWRLASTISQWIVHTSALLEANHTWYGSGAYYGSIW